MFFSKNKLCSSKLVSFKSFVGKYLIFYKKTVIDFYQIKNFQKNLPQNNI